MSYKLTEEQLQYLSASKTVELTKQELTQKVKELRFGLNIACIAIIINTISVIVINFTIVR